MTSPIWVITHQGEPPETLFNATRGLGTPLVIDEIDKIAYFAGSSGISTLGSSVLFLEKGVTQDIQSSSPSSTGLSFAASPNKTYLIQLSLLVQTSSSSKGPVLTLTFPSNITRGSYSLTLPLSPTSQSCYHGALTGSTTQISAAATGMLANTPLPITGTLSFSTSGASTGSFAALLSSEV